MEFSNKTALITGAGGHIGRHIALNLAKSGASVAVVDFAVEPANETVQLITEAGGNAKAYICDVRKYENVHACFEAVKADFGSVDILVTAAGGSTRGDSATLANQKPEVIENNIGVNLYGALWFAKEAAADFTRRAEECGSKIEGRVIFVASILGIQGNAKFVEYSVGKAGIIAMSKSLAKELGQYGITVNCVSPGLVNRPDNDWDVRPTNYLGEYCKADDIADAVEFLASSKGKFITGHNLVVDGGRCLGLKGVK
ncbi:MAG: SDR family oxidoreductase [Clostridiales bacterium]|nr:SDR family oxidoreductase [Clostridiales bacterium]